MKVSVNCLVLASMLSQAAASPSKKQGVRFAKEEDFLAHMKGKESSRRTMEKIPKSDEPIVGGTPVEMPYPYFAHWYDIGCGATLIHDDILLTAAHVSMAQRDSFQQ